MIYRPSSSTLAAATLAVALAAPAAAQYFASPSGDDGNDCLSPETACRTLQAAIDKAPDGSNIQLGAGTYAEEISINSRNELSIQGEQGVEIVPPPTTDQGSPALVQVNRSTGIRFWDLTLTGYGATSEPSWGGFRFFGGEEIEIGRCTIQDLSGGGIVLHRHSNAVIRQSIIRRNRFHGVRVDADTSVEITGEPFGQGTSIVEDNLFAGVLSNRGAISFLGSVIIRRNNLGVAAAGGNIWSCCGGSVLEITDNRGSGVQMVGGELELRTPALVARNRRYGLDLYGATVETARFSSLDERVIIRENGSASDPFSAGIFAASSSIDLALAEVVANPNDGVLLQDNSSLRTYLTTIADNGGRGVRAETLSTVRLVFDTVAAGNGRSDVSCDRTSVLAGDTDGAVKVQCGNLGKGPSGP